MNSKTIIVKGIIGLIVFLAVGSISYSQPFGQSARFDGINDYLSVPDNTNLNQTSNISIEMWIKPCNINGHFALLNKNFCVNNQTAYNLRINDGKLNWVWDTDGCGNGSSIYESNNAIILNGVWQHVAAVHTSTGVTLYHNGIQISGNLTGSYSNLALSNEPLRLGATRAISGILALFYEGLMDEVRIWNYSMSAFEVQSRYNNTLTGNEQGLVAYYNLDITGSGTGLTIPNIASFSGTSINATSIGTASTPYFGNIDFCGAVGIDEFDSKDTNCNFEIRSNPISGIGHIKSDSEIKSIEVYSINGKIVLQKTYNSGILEAGIDCSILSAGMHFIKLQTKNCITSRKILIN